ncbi:MAG TPA: response regulator [Verrucomicrobiae bacterium]|jgi:CheY-like chemotaxis protein|nr:response regulator [Verrucomicrobiae bacterium]
MSHAADMMAPRLAAFSAQKCDGDGPATAGAAHAFNNSLAAILMQLNLLQQNPELPGAVRESLQAIEAEAARARDLLREIRMAGSPQPPRLPTGADSMPGGSETILLVEDEAALRRYTALMLRKLGYAVLEAGDVPEALAVWQKSRGKIALLLTDMVMPGKMTGWKLAQALQKERPGLPIIIASGSSEEAPELPGGVVTFIAKPYSSSDLAQLVRQQLDQNRTPVAP